MYDFIHSTYGIVTVNAILILIGVIVYNAIKTTKIQNDIKNNVEEIFKEFSMVFPIKKKDNIGNNQYKNFILLSALYNNGLDVYKIVDKSIPYKKVTITIKDGCKKKLLNKMNKTLTVFYEKYFSYEEIKNIVNNNKKIASEILELLDVNIEDYSNTKTFNAGELKLTQINDIVQLTLEDELSFILDNTYAYQTLTNAKKKKRNVTVHWNKNISPIFIDQFSIQVEK